MQEIIDYKSVSWTVPEAFDGSLDNVSSTGPGRFVFTDLEPASLRGLVVPRFSFSWNVEPEAEIIPSSVDLFLWNPQDHGQRKILFSDATATVTSFVEDNLGKGHLVPYVNGREGPRYELIFVTVDPIVEQHALLEIWWEPDPNFDNWSCRGGRREGG